MCARSSWQRFAEPLFGTARPGFARRVRSGLRRPGSFARDSRGRCGEVLLDLLIEHLVGLEDGASTSNGLSKAETGGCGREVHLLEDHAEGLFFFGLDGGGRGGGGGRGRGVCGGLPDPEAWHTGALLVPAAEGVSAHALRPLALLQRDDV